MPARRADYIHFTGSAPFPLKFCPVRWLENSKVIFRALDVIPNLVKFVKCSKEAKKTPACASYSTVEKAVGDRMLPVKLAFMLSIPEELEPFLTEFQTDKLLHWITSCGHCLLDSSGKRSCKLPTHPPSCVGSTWRSLVTAATFDIGFAANNELRKIPRPSQLTVLSFKKDFVKRCKLLGSGWCVFSKSWCTKTVHCTGGGNGAPAADQLGS